MYNRLPRRFQNHAAAASEYIGNLGLPDLEAASPGSTTSPVVWNWSLENLRDAARVGARALPGAAAIEAAQWVAGVAYDAYSSPLIGSSQTQVLTPESGSQSLRGVGSKSQSRSSGGSAPKSARNLFSKSPAKSPAVNWWDLANSPSYKTPSNFSTPGWGTPSSQLSLNARLNRRWNRHPLSQRERSWKTLAGRWKFRAAINRRTRIRKNPVRLQRRTVRNLRRKLRRRHFKLIFARGSQRRRRRRKLSQSRKALYRHGF